MGWKGPGYQSADVHTRAHTATPLALEDRFRHSIHHNHHPLAHSLGLKTAMHRTVCASTTDTTL